jgi:mannosyl-3-phosphoglycerate phosphatase
MPRTSGRARLHAALRQAGFRCTRGSRFDHVTGVTDKGVAVTRLCELYAEAAGTIVPSVGLGDAINDLPLLKAVHVPIVVPNRGSDAARLLQKVPSARVTERKGPAGWSEAIKRLVGSTTWRSTARLFERGDR